MYWMLVCAFCVVLHCAKGTGSPRTVSSIQTRGSVWTRR